MPNIKEKYFILTGDPGVGKTTLIKKLCTLLVEKGIKTRGFYTEEVRNNGIREGFDVISLNGVRGRLARDQTLLNISVKPRVGKYGVLVKEFENVGLSALSQPDSKSVLVIDEIGKMEFFSESFKKKIKDIFSSACNYIVLATIPIRKADSIIENIRSNNLSKIWTVTRHNRDTLHEEILQQMLEVLQQ